MQADDEVTESRWSLSVVHGYKEEEEEGEITEQCTAVQ
jgi:hypothetical protein